MPQETRYEVDTWSALVGEWCSASLEYSRTPAEARAKADAFAADQGRPVQVMEVHPDGTRSVVEDGPYRTTAHVGEPRPELT